MSDVLEFVLDGLEQALELERELGVRTVEFDRGILAPAPQPVSVPRVEKTVPAQPPPRPAPVPPRTAPQPPPVADNPPSTSCTDLVFVHDRPLSEKGVEMMAKIITAMGRTTDNAPIVVAPPLPRAKIVVVLGGLALKKYFPELRGEPGLWQKMPNGGEILITYSPEYILRFASVTPAVEKIKKDMWQSLKAVIQRLA